MKRKPRRTKLTLAVAALTILFLSDRPSSQAESGDETRTPIKHLVVILSRERLIRPLLRDVSECNQSCGRTSFRGKVGNPVGDRIERSSDDHQPKFHAPVSVRPLSAAHLRSAA